MQQRIAVFPGSFDPVTVGHLDIVLRALPLFDKIVIGVGINASKKYFLSLEQRLELLQAVFAPYGDRIEVDTYQELTAFYCRRKGAQFLLRGLRNGTDFDYENTIAHLNNMVGQGIETVFLISSPQYSFYSSTIVREIAGGGGDIRPFIPESALELFKTFCQENKR